jgi:hypothetical protein
MRVLITTMVAMGAWIGMGATTGHAAGTRPMGSHESLFSPALVRSASVPVAPSAAYSYATRDYGSGDAKIYSDGSYTSTYPGFVEARSSRNRSNHRSYGRDYDNRRWRGDSYYRGYRDRHYRPYYYKPYYYRPYNYRPYYHRPYYRGPYWQGRSNYYYQPGLSFSIGGSLHGDRFYPSVGATWVW